MRSRWMAMACAAATWCAAGAAWAGRTSCRALDVEGATIATAEADSSLACRTQVKGEVRRRRCHAGARQVRFQYQRGSEPPVPATIFCAP